MSRAHVAWLVVLAALLVFDGGRAAPPSAEAAVVFAARGAAPSGLGEHAVAAELREMNPALSDRQLARIATAVVKYSAKYQLDPALVIAVIKRESTARPWVRSPKGAIGLMQVMPHMMGALDVAGNLTTIESNIEAGCMILADNIRRLGEHRGISSYFWGSEIRGVSYLRQVQEARAAVGRDAES
ncbi:MAG: transglycosylase SLT domain-containing protein [Deltaproteobacteria bacterium]|nr:transglycosylase SLT domain-containing protein [Deltaproteobacteria bacterium]